ncbi:MAG: glutaredoxin domain-containing protein [bacterium]
MAEHNVVLYSTATCPFCIQTKKYLEDKGISYTNHDVAADQEARKEMVEKSSQMGVPVLIIDEKIIIGFDRQEIEAALGL